MARRLFLIITVGMLGIMNSPTFLAATDHVKVTGLDYSGAVQTVVASKDDNNEIIVDVSDSEVSNADSAVELEVGENSYQVEAEVVAAPAPANSIAIAGRVIDIVDVNNTAVDAAGHVNKYGDKFLYGHNSSAVFGGLADMGVGNVFTVAYGGVSTNYQVSEVVIYEKISDTILRAAGVDYKMRVIVNGKGRYDMVLMTCYGTSYGNGDASHRLVLFANRI